MVIFILMFLPTYTLPKYPCNMLIRRGIMKDGTETEPDIDSGTDTNVELERETNILRDIITNPIEVFIFLILYSIWLGGFTRKQIFDYLNKKNK